MFEGGRSSLIRGIAWAIALTCASAFADSVPVGTVDADRLRAIQWVASGEPERVIGGLESLKDQPDVPPEVLGQKNHPDPVVRRAVLRFSATRGIYGPLIEALADNETVFTALGEIRQKRVVEAAGPLKSLAADPRRNAVLRVTTMEVLADVAPTTLVQYLDDLGPATAQVAPVHRAHLYWLGRLASELRVLRASRAYLGHVIAENGPSAHMLLHPDIRYGHDPYGAQEGNVRMRSFRVRDIESLGGTRYGVDVRVVVEESGSRSLQLRLDYLVLDLDRGDPLVRRVVRGTGLPFG